MWEPGVAFLDRPIQALAAAQTSNLLKRDLASSPWSGSGRAMPKPAMSSRISAPMGSVYFTDWTMTCGLD